MIYAIGDSFTAGAELEGHLWDTPGQGAWPEVLESLINHPVINKGRSATGNTRIVKRSIDAVLEKADGIVICWTYSLRIEFIDDVTYMMLPQQNKICGGYFENQTPIIDQY